MRKAERILLLIVLISIVLKHFHVPGASGLLVLGGMAASLFYFALSFILFKKKDEPWSALGVVFAVLLGFILSQAIIGTIFRLQSWPGASFMLLSAVVLLGIFAVLALVLDRIKKDPLYKRTLSSILVLFVFSLLLISPLFGMYEDYKYRNVPALQQAVKAHRENPTLETEARRHIESQRFSLPPDMFKRYLESEAKRDPVYQKYYLEELENLESEGIDSTRLDSLQS